MAVAKKSRKAKATDRLRPWRRRSPMRKLDGGKVVLKCEAVPEKEIEGEKKLCCDEGREFRGVLEKKLQVKGESKISFLRDQETPKRDQRRCSGLYANRMTLLLCCCITKQVRSSQYNNSRRPLYWYILELII